ncbi:hypothetical protein HDU96_006272 [Phlyctochytrium bullatum]|nr:hypothetical protein HDU96_006272 [Phlyctochytrium bullatum]
MFQPFILSEVVLEVAHYLHPNNLAVLASACRLLSGFLTLNTLSLSFAKAHLEALARSTLGKNEEHLNPPAWLHLFQEKAHVDYGHPLLFNYAMTAIALHGFTFTKNLGILGPDWNRGQDTPKDRRRRELLITAFERGLCSIESLSAEERDSFYFENAFEVAVVCRSTDMVDAIAGFATINCNTLRPRGLRLLDAAFTIAARHQCMDMVRAILAAVSGHTQVIETVSDPFVVPLLRACAKANYRNPIALLPDHHPVFKITDNHMYHSALTEAVWRNHLDLVDLLLQKGATPGCRTLCAAAGEIPSLILRFLELGADPNDDYFGMPALHIAVASERPDAVRMLLDAGGDLEAHENLYRTALIIACCGQSPEVVQMLLDAGADPEHVWEGETVVHVAMRYSLRLDGEHVNLSVLKVGLERVPGLVERRESGGISPLDLVVEEFCRTGTAEVRKMLIEAGALAQHRDKQKMTGLTKPCRTHASGCEAATRTGRPTARRAAGKGRPLKGPWNGTWVDRLEETAPVAYEHPMLRNHALAAVELYGFWFTEEKDLGILEREWKDLIFLKAFGTATLCGTVETAKALVRKWTALGLLSFLADYFMVESFWRLAANNRSLVMIRTILTALSDGAVDIKTITESDAMTLVKACITQEFYDPIELLPDNHPAFTPKEDEYYSPLAFAPNAVLHGDTALHVAVHAGRVDTARLLLDAGAQLEAVNDEGLTPLLVAGQRNHPDVVEMLLDAGADARVMHPDTGETLLHVATQNM